MTLQDDAGAKVLLERAQRIRETRYGADHPETVRTLVNLAILYQETGDYTGSATAIRARAARWRERLRGPADPLTLHVLAGAAVVLSELGGDFAGSARLNERLLALTERVVRPDGSAPEDSAGEPGDGSAAISAITPQQRRLAERSLAIAERRFGPKHPEVARSLHTLATILRGTG